MQARLRLLAALALLPAAAWGRGRPDWVDGSSSKYPRQRYLLGVGLGDDRQTAEDRARAEISKIFTTQVDAVTSFTESETSTDRGGSFSKSLSQTVRTASRKALEGVELVESWKDKATRQHYALAVLERGRAVSAVTDKISELDRQARGWKDEMDGAAAKLPRVKAAMKLLALLKARKELSDELRVLDASGRGVPSPFDEAGVRARAAKALAELDVVVDIR